MFISKHCFKRETKSSWFENNSVPTYTFSWGQILLQSSVDTECPGNCIFPQLFVVPLCFILELRVPGFQQLALKSMSIQSCRSNLSAQILQVLSSWPEPVPKLVYFLTSGKTLIKVWISVRRTHHTDVHGLGIFKSALILLQKIHYLMIIEHFYL